MVQGCTSDAGKSMLVAALCRLFANQGLQVAPFKPQNMALNSAVTSEGGEIGRAQALQAVAAKTEATVDMNPVLLKPNTDTGAQVIIHGLAIGNLEALDYHHYKPKAAQAVLDSFQKLKNNFEIVFVEGAGSPAEINLREGDIANMGFAETADVPVILIADIDKGGVFAHLIGTLECLSASERDRIKGFVINKFRGDLALLQDGLDWLEQKTNKPVLGVLPYLHDLYLDAEDAVQFKQKSKDKTGRLKVIAPLLPHISNHTDFDALQQHPQVDFQIIKHQQSIPPADLIILPGSKNVGFDLTWLKEQGWQQAIQKHLRYGGKLIGICGGLQMMGHKILDPLHIESTQKEHIGLGLFDYESRLTDNKTLLNQVGKTCFGSEVKGYEIHTGNTDHHFEQSFIRYEHKTEGFVSDDNQVIGTYLHGLFDHPATLKALLNWAGQQNVETFDLEAFREQQLESLAEMLAKHIDLTKLNGIIENDH